MNATEAYCIQVKELTKTFPGGLFEKDRQVLHGLSFNVRKGRVTGFVGANGAGKTTTLKCLLGFIFPNSGSIQFFENETRNSSVLQKIGFFPERPYIYEFLSAKEYLKLHWDLSGGGEGFDAAKKDVLEQVDLLAAENKRLRSFSKGMLQRAGIAQAILRRPEFLILDEPMSGLDPVGRLLIKEILRKLKKAGTSIFFSSHLLHDLEELCDDILMIDEGRIIFTGSLDDLRRQHPGLNLEEIFREVRK